MFYKNVLKERETKTLTLTFDDFEKAPEPVESSKEKQFDTPYIGYNFKVKNGVLEDNYGFRDLHLPYSEDDPTEHRQDINCEEILEIWLFRWFDPYALTTDSFIFYLDKNLHFYYFYEFYFFGDVGDSAITMTSYPTTFSYRVGQSNMFLMSSATDDLVVYAGGTNIYSLENTPKFLSTCIHENSFYGILATDDSKVVYTKELIIPQIEKTEFNELLFLGGEGAKLRKLFSLNDYVYLFRDNGIVKLYPYSTSATLSISHVYYSSSFIMPETIVRCGEEIYFLTREGMYKFDGSSVDRVELEVFDKIDMSDYQTFKASCMNGKYYLACRINFDDDEKILCENSASGYKNNAVLIYDTFTKDVEIIRGVDIRDFEPVETNLISKMLCCFYNDYKSHLGEITHDGMFFDQVMPKKWTSVKTDCGYKGKTKLIKKVKLNALKDCQLKIETDKETKTFNIKGSDKTQTIKLGVRGETFSVSFVSTEKGQKIATPEFEVEVIL